MSRICRAFLASSPAPSRKRAKIDWRELSLNPNAIHLLEQNLNKINWGHLSKNPNAINLLEKNPRPDRQATLARFFHRIRCNYGIDNR